MSQDKVRDYLQRFAKDVKTLAHDKLAVNVDMFDWAVDYILKCYIDCIESGTPLPSTFTPNLNELAIDYYTGDYYNNESKTEETN